jgi:GT2 family glycosyltransferase
MAKLAVHLVTWNTARYVPHTFASLRAQTSKDWELLVVDNASSDTSVALMHQQLLNFPVASRVIVNGENAGFAKGHNQALKKTTGPYVLMLNQDMYIAPDCFEKLIAFLDAHPEAAAVTPRLMRWDFKGIESLGLEKSLTNSIDALGLQVFRNRRVVEQYTGHEWYALEGKLPHPLPVFGVSGAFPMFRRGAIEAISFSDGSFFDESHFMYKEDVDVAYRLAAAGLKSFVVLDAVAHHDRTGAGPKEMSDVAALKNKKAHNKTVRYYSYKNHLAVLYKNEYWQNLLLDFPWIFWYELKKFIYFLAFDSKVLVGLSDLVRNRAALKIKRQDIKKARKLSWREMRKHWE